MANPHLHNLEILVPWEKRFHTQCDELRFILRLNRLGRLHLHPSHDVPLALWPTIFARMTDSIDDRGALQYFLRHKPALVRTRNGGGVKRCCSCGL